MRIMISVVIPCYNEQDVLPLLHKRLSAEIEKWKEPCEVLLVDDGSSDQTWQLLKSFSRKDPSWKAIRFSRNFGHQIAVSAGIQYATGDCVIVMDADLQDPPEELGRFIEKWREGYEVVYAIRTQRKEGIFKRASYGLFYRILRKLANIHIPYDSGDFCIIDRRVVDLLNAMPEKNRFVRGLRAWIGFRQIGLTYKRHERAGGEVKYTLRGLLRLALNGIFSFSTVPLRITTLLGLIVSFIAFLGAIFTFLQRIFIEQFTRIGLSPVPGFATIVISILFMGGVQLICLGIVGEYIGRIYDEVKQRPLWVIQESVGINSSSSPHRDNIK